MTIFNYSEIFESFLENYFSSVKGPETLYEPMKYTLKLGGKRLRPLSLLASASYYNEGVVQSALHAALAVELFHNFTLLHDDIMDEASVRRGEPTAHVLYGRDSAILTGDVMLIKCYELLMNYDQETANQLIRIFNKMAVELCEGQRLDMDFQTRENVSVIDYIYMITLKTSVLLGASMQMGALIGGANEDEQKALYEFGKNVGIAFQIQDDILDVFGDSKEVGKKKAGDIIQNKKTYLYLKALELAEGSEKESLILLYARPTLPEEEEVKINTVIKVFNNLVVKEYAGELKMAYKDLALSHLENAGLSEGHKKELVSFADFLLTRSY